MSKVIVDTGKSLGRIKMMNCVNSGPKPRPKTEHPEMVRDGYTIYADLEIPATRNHDVAMVKDYGAPQVVDWHMIFPNFDADENDPESYDFHYTDEYTAECVNAGSDTLYRLGASIEHGSKKYGTLPPKDFNKWARICEHIIAHLNYGWGNGLHLNISRWEIWAEPDLDEDDSPTKRCWGGTKAQYFELYKITSKHLKNKFPSLKIGGPGLAFRADEWTDDFLSFAKENDCPIDFFSFHCYTADPYFMGDMADKLRRKLIENGYGDAELICNEYNYMKSWLDEEFDYSIQSIIGNKGAVYVAACMAHCHDKVDQLYYYDVRTNGIFNGLYDIYYAKRPTYAVFVMYRDLARLGENIETVSDDRDVFAVSAKGESGFATMLVYFTNEDDKAPFKEITVEYKGDKAKLTPYEIGADNMPCEMPFKTYGDNITLTLKPNTVIYIKAEK